MKSYINKNVFYKLSYTVRNLNLTLKMNNQLTTKLFCLLNYFDTSQILRNYIYVISYIVIKRP